MQHSITFKSSGLSLAGNLYLPDSLTEQQPALVLSGPFTGVKEQVTGLYAQRLSDRGFVCLAFDHRNFGASDGEPRQHEDAAGKLIDLHSAVSYLRGLPTVDPERIGACGICLGTSYILRFAAFDPRVGAIALIAGAYNSPHTMQRLMGTDRYRSRLLEFAEIRERQWATGEVSYMPAIAQAEIAAMPGQEPFDYYGTERSDSPGWQNRVTTLSTAELMTFEAADSAEFISPTPLLMIHGKVDAYCSPESAQTTFERAGEPKELFWLPTTNHIDLYDVEEFVAPAIEKTASWLQKYLSGR